MSKTSSRMLGLVLCACALTLTSGVMASRPTMGDPFYILNNGTGGGSSTQIIDFPTMPVNGVRPPTLSIFSYDSGGNWGEYFEPSPGDGGALWESEVGQVDDANPNHCGRGNPILPATRNKIETEVDFYTSGEMPLSLIRTYNLNWHGRGLFGAKWTSSFDYRLVLDTDGWSCYPRQGGGQCGLGNRSQINAIRPDGRTIKYVRNPADGVFYEGKPGPVSSIVRQLDGSFLLHGEDNATEIYSPTGYVQSVRNAQGIGWTYSYTNGTYPYRITHTSGRYVEFSWSGEYLVAVRDPAGNLHRYGYTPGQWPANGYHGLTSYIRPAASPVTTIYHYELPLYATRLAGKSINGKRYSTFTYDYMGYPASTEHQGQDRYSFSYSIGAGDIWTVVETNPLGRQTTYEYKNGNLLTTIGHPSQYCPGSVRGKSYDANGYLDVAIDFNGNATDYDYNARGQIQRIVEAAGTPAQRIRTFVWDHAVNRLLSETLESHRRTNYAYTTDNRIASIRVTNLSANGVSGQVRETTFVYTYHGNGMLASVTEDGPIPGGSDAVTTSYSALGDLVSVHNSLGHVIRYGAHTGLGTPGRVETPNGHVTEITYGPVDEVLHQRTYSGAQIADTALNYADGLLSSVLQADGVHLRYQYDAQRRRIAEYLRDHRGGYIVRQTAYNAMSLPVSITASRTAYPPDTRILGVIDGVFPASGGDYEVSGWACSTGYDSPIAVHMYLGGPAGSSVHGSAYMANVASEPQVATACGTIGQAHRFRISLGAELRGAHGGKTIHIHGISPAGYDNSLIGGSGQVTVPPLPPPVHSVDDAQLVAQSVPGSMQRGHSYNVSVTVRNTGNTTWAPATGHYALGSANPYDDTYWGMSRVALPHAVSPGEVVTFNWIVVPNETGMRNFQWRMVNDGVAWFGAASSNVEVGVWAPDPPSPPPPYEPCGPDIPGCHVIPMSQPVQPDFVNRFVTRSVLLARQGASSSPTRSPAIQMTASSMAASTIEYQTFIDYDELGRVRARRGNNGQHVTYMYDLNGNVRRTTDAFGRETWFAYDAFDRLVHTTDAAGGNAYFGYDALDHLVRVDDPRGNVTIYVYDGFGQSWANSSPDTGTTAYQFDGAGLLTRQTRNDGSWLQYTYDGLGRLLSVGNDQEWRAYAYDWCQNGRGRLCAADTPDGYRHFGYTPDGGVSSTRDWTPQSDHQIGYAYDAMGRLTGVHNPGGTSVGYGYHMGQLALIEVTINGVVHTVANQFDYSSTGALTRLVYGHGLPKDRRHDSDGRLIETHDHGFLGHTYSYNAVDELTSIQNWASPQNGQTFTYDSLSRLTGFTSGTGNQNYAYDANGNRIFHWWLNPDPYHVDPGSNRLLSEGIQYGYDARGNRSSQSWGGSTASYQYDSFNRLTSVSRDVVSQYTNPNYASQTLPAGTTTYTVNALDQRVAKSSPLGSSRFFYGGQNTLRSEYTNGQWTDYIWMGGEPIGFVRNAQLYFTHTDRLGRPEVVSDQNRNARWIAANYPFDRALTANSLGGNYNLGLPGQYFDAETGHWYNGFRDYDGRTGSYLQSDPIGLAGGLNTYSYVEGNPVSRTDPLGLDYTVCTYPGAGGFGHVGIGVNNSKTYGYYPSSASASALTGTPGVLQRDEKEPVQCTTGKSTPAQDVQMKLRIAAVASTPGTYTFTGNNCVNFVRSVLSSAGISSPGAIAPSPFFNGLKELELKNSQGNSGP